MMSTLVVSFHSVSTSELKGFGCWSTGTRARGVPRRSNKGKSLSMNNVGVGGVGSRV